MTLSSDLSWSSHITSFHCRNIRQEIGNYYPDPDITAICTKANQKLGFIKRNLKGTPREFKRLAYVAFVRSGMEYASIIWNPHYTKDSDALRVQRKAARWITSKHDRGTSVTALLHQLHLEPLEERRRISRLTFLYKILNEHVAVPMNQLDLVLFRNPLLQELLLSGTHYQTPSPHWLQYHPSEAICLLHHARRRAHSIAEIFVRRLAIIIQIQIQSNINVFYTSLKSTFNWLHYKYAVVENTGLSSFV